jgi:hypothetical protein
MMENPQYLQRHEDVGTVNGFAKGFSLGGDPVIR